MSLGAPIVRFISDGIIHEINSYGDLVTDAAGKTLKFQSVPYYLIGFSLIFLAFITTMSYKNINRQLKLGRILFLLYFLLLIFAILLPIFGRSFFQLPENSEREMAYGYILLVAGFPFTFMANLGIKRDKNLLDSLNRLR